MGQVTNMYRFLARLYMLEIDEELFAKLKELTFPTGNMNERMGRGYERISNYLKSCNMDNHNVDNRNVDYIEELAVDYAATFLAAGVAEGLAAFPYASVYTSRKNLIGQESCVSVAKAYAEAGVEISDDIPRVPEDHISLELEFMASLIDQGDTDKAKLFFNDCIWNWGPLFALDVEKYATTDFYKGLGDLTYGFFHMEKERIGTLEGGVA